jgi:hypothetical protein
MAAISVLTGLPDRVVVGWLALPMAAWRLRLGRPRSRLRRHPRDALVLPAQPARDGLGLALGQPPDVGTSIGLGASMRVVIR